MRVHNVTRDTSLATHVQRARSYGARLKGLMFLPSLPPGQGLLLEGDSSIHTFFMRFPIDVLYLDGQGTILRAVAAMPPNRIGPLFTRGCRSVLELPAGTIARSQSQVGDHLALLDAP